MSSRTVTFRIGGPLTPVVRMLMIATAIIFVLQIIITPLIEPGWILNTFGLSHRGLFQKGMIWQLFTYIFLHDGFLHLFFNLLSLWMFGGELEEKWGGRNFLTYYIASGTVAGMCIAGMNYYSYIEYGVNTVTIGSSGAIYGIFLAYALLWPHRTVYLYFILPVKIWTLLLIFGSIEFLGTVLTAAGAGAGVSHIGHLGGILAGFLILYFYPVYGYTSTRGRKGFMEYFQAFKKKMRLRSTKERIQTRIKAKAIIDETLAKIAKEGMNSLSPDERKRLEWARKNYFPDNEHTIH